MSLTDIEKLAIEAMVKKGTPVAEIKTTLGKTPKSRLVEKFIEEAGLNNQRYDHNTVLQKLAAAGLDNEDSKRLVEKAISTLGKDATTSEVYNEAVRYIGPRERMVGKEKGVKVMTPEASKMGDQSRGEKTESRSTRDAIFRPNG